jgi:hypothetical protein
MTRRITTCNTALTASPSKDNSTQTVGYAPELFISTVVSSSNPRPNLQMFYKEDLNPWRKSWICLILTILGEKRVVTWEFIYSNACTVCFLLFLLDCHVWLVLHIEYM